MPRRRAKIAPSQELEIHRYLIAALQTGPRRPQWLRPSNGPTECVCRRSYFFVKRKAIEYCEQRLYVQYTRVFRDGIIEQLKKKNEVLLVFAGCMLEEKRKPREATTCVFTRASFPRFRSSALKGDSMRICAVMTKSSREGCDASRSIDRACESFVMRVKRMSRGRIRFATQGARGTTR